MRCLFPVVVYPCPGGSREFCREFASSEALPTWREKYKDAGVTCYRHWTIGGSQCDHFDWECSDRSCDAKGKSLQLCADILETDPYDCYYVEDNFKAGVRKAATGFPVGSMALLWLATMCPLGCCAFSSVLAWDMVKEYGFKLCTMMFGIFILLWGGILALDRFLKSLEPSPRGIVATDFQNITLVNSTTDELILPYEDPVFMEDPYEGWEFLLVFLALDLALASCGLLVYFLTSRGVQGNPEADTEPSAPLVHPRTA